VVSPATLAVDRMTPERCRLHRCGAVFHAQKDGAQQHCHRRIPAFFSELRDAVARR
jgi:hypothetical protein